MRRATAGPWASTPSTGPRWCRPSRPSSTGWRASTSGCCATPGRRISAAPAACSTPTPSPSGARRIAPRPIVIATGGRPTMPDISGIELAISSDEMFDLPTLPARLVIVGGGYIACEFACIMQGLGSQVTQLYRRDLPLRGFDHDLREVLCEEMRKGGVDLRLDTNAVSLARNGSAIAVTTTSGEIIEADQVLFATGRKPNVAGLGLETAGIEPTGGAPSRWTRPRTRASQYLRHRRCHRPHQPHAGGDPRGPLHCRDPLQRQPPSARSPRRGNGGLHHARARHGRAHRGRSPQHLPGGEHLQRPASARSSTRSPRERRPSS